MSGDGADFSLDLEATDVVEAAAIARGDEHVAVIAYSYGALAANRLG